MVELNFIQTEATLPSLTFLLTHPLAFCCRYVFEENEASVVVLFDPCNGVLMKKLCSYLARLGGR